MTPITIQDVKVITTQPYAAQRLVIVKVITSEPGLYGLGCATFTQRFHAVVAALEHHVIPYVIGRDGTVLARQVGPFSPPETLEAALKKWIAG